MSLPVSLVGMSQAGGVIMGPGAVQVRVNGLPISLVGDDVASHGPGIHQGPKMVQGSAMFRINGIAVVRTTSLASCGHDANGFPNVTVAI